MASATIPASGSGHHAPICPESASVHKREQLTHFVAESERLGLISETDSEPLTRSLTEPETPVQVLQVPAAEITSVDGGADADELLRQGADRGRTRLLVCEHGTVLGSVHARDALARPVPELTEGTTVADAISLLRQRRASLAAVLDGSGRRTGMVSLDDLLARYLQPQAV
ncbi:hypothetical protein ADL12_06755 [Streptomyces regalis]|uniref:CBS domain-containing protein n=1 Tax=Streptomyces regalis TaxID=68262 RepID=A0A0X3VG88_9ACTN|nr:hypothetical protein ADL12_06755 [Streptomyces regalis]